MNQIDKISKEALSLLNYSKDVAVGNLSAANNSGRLEPKLTDEQLRSVVSLVEVSLSQGYQKGLNTFQKTLKTTLEDKIKEEALKKKK